MVRQACAELVEVLTTNGFFYANVGIQPFALSMSKGKFLFFP
jgi:hypothetical protein